MAEVSASRQLGGIQLGTRGGTIPGTLRLAPGGLLWRSSAGGRSVEVSGGDVASAEFSRDVKGYSLSLTKRDGAFISLGGFREDDLPALRQTLGEGDGHAFKTEAGAEGEVKKEAGAEGEVKEEAGAEGEVKAEAGADDARLPPAEGIVERARATSGHNWGELSLRGSTLVFAVGGLPAFSIPLTDALTAQLGRDDVLVDFPADDGTADERADALAEIGFHIPKGNPQWSAAAAAGEGEVEGEAAAASAAKLLFEAVNAHVDLGGGAGDALATFSEVAVIVPRGRFDVEMHGGHLKLLGATQDFRLTYDSILRLFVLPKTNASQTVVVASLDPPIRKGATFYPHILFQFPTLEETTLTLTCDEAAMEAKNAKNRGKLEPVMTGSSADVFARALRGISGARVTRPGSFRDHDGSGVAVRCSYKADDGFLYPLERAFFYIQKPPVLIPHEDVDSVEFLRPAQGATATKTFDLAIRLKAGAAGGGAASSTGAGGVEHLFRSIPRPEWSNLFEFIRSKNLRIENFREAQAGPGVAAGNYADLAGLAGEDDDDDDEDFDAGAGDDDDDDDSFAGSDQDSEGFVDSDADEAEEVAAAEAAEAEASKQAIAGDDEDGAEAKKAARAAARAAKRAERVDGKRPRGESLDDEAGGEARQAASGDGEEAGPPAAARAAPAAKKPRKKKDPNAPKRPLSAFMFFGQERREGVRTDNPGIAFGEIGKILGELWKAAGDDDRAPFEAKAAADRERYQREMAAWKVKQGEAGGAEAEDAGAGEDDGAGAE